MPNSSETTAQKTKRTAEIEQAVRSVALDQRGKPIPLNADGFKRLTDNQRIALRTVVEGAGHDYDQYEARMKRLKPPTNHLPPGVIRHER
jgi:hypothetical protein